MSYLTLPPSIVAKAVSLQQALREHNVQGSMTVTTEELRYETISSPRRNHEERLHNRMPLFISEIRRESLNTTPLPLPYGSTWEDQVCNVCETINSFDNNTRNDERILQHYQLGLLMYLRGFSNNARDFARVYLLPNLARDFWPVCRRAYTLYSIRGTYNIPGTTHILCYALRHLSEDDFQELIVEARNAILDEE